MAFYPGKFVLITDILDIFGKLVYERLKIKAEYYKLVLHYFNIIVFNIVLYKYYYININI